MTGLRARVSLEETRRKELLGEPLIEVRCLRSGRLESEHRVAAVLQPEGGSARVLGDGERACYLRSAGKPFQGLAVLEVILESGFRLSDAEIAVMCASHGGQPLHVELVRGLLVRAGLSEELLRCGAHEPMHAGSRQELWSRGEQAGPVHNNCSGKHAGMLIASRLQGHDLEGYLAPEHPVQVRNRELLGLFLGLAPEDVPVGIDGCGVPAFVASLTRCAAAWERLGRPGSVSFPAEPWRRLLEAIRTCPVAYSWEGGLCERLITACEGRVLGKIGAEGFYGLTLPGEGPGLAVKVIDGSRRALEPALAALLLRHVDDWSDTARGRLETMAAPELRNHAGTPVGRMEVRMP